MKLNKISNVLRKQGKGALYTSAVLSMLAAPAYAQAAEEAAAASDDVEVIEVRGMRGTMTRSLNEKKNTAAIVDAIAAADFGDLPGLSLSDVIENVSGATGHRLKGSQNEISIRGLGSYWGNATFNGRTITNAGPNRAVNFKKFPSDLIDKVVIYKTQQADLVEGGTSGTIEVGSLRAVDHGKSNTSIEYQAAYNDYYNDGGNQSEWGHKATFSTVQSWETESAGSMGFSFGYVWNDSANPEEVYTTSSTMGACSFKAADGSALSAASGRKCFDTRYIDSGNDTAVSRGRTDTLTLGPNADASKYGENGEDHLAKFDQDSIFYIPETSYWRATKDADERKSIVGTFQWVPNDDWDVNLDFASSRLEYTEERMELYQERGENLNSESLIFDEGGVVLYEEGRGKAALQGESRNQVDEYDGYGIVVEHVVNDNLELTFDASYNESFRDRVRQRNRIRTESDIAYSLDSRGTVPELYYGDTLIYDEDDTNFKYMNEGGQLVANTDYAGAAFDPTQMSSFMNGGQAAIDQDVVNNFDLPFMDYKREYERRNDEVWALRFDGLYTFDDNEYIASIKAGVRYSREHLFALESGKTSLDIFTGEYRDDDDWNIDDHAPGTSTDFHDYEDGVEYGNMIGRVEQCVNNGHNFDGFFNRDGSAGQASEFYTYDARCVNGAIMSSIQFEADDYVAPEDMENWYPTDSYYDIGENTAYKDANEMDIREDIWAAYVMANIDTEIMGYPITGNAGVRYVRTDTDSNSWGDQVIVTETADDDGNLTYNTVIDGDNVIPMNLNRAYTEWLPSINLTMAINDEWQVKVAAFRAMSRLPMQDMSAGVVASICDDDDGGCDSYENQIESVSAAGTIMDPYTSSNYDISLEWYPSQDMAITLGGYWKDFNGGVTETAEFRQPTVTFVDQDGNVDNDHTYTENISHSVIQVADEDSTIKGFELTWQKHFTELPAPWNGIGVKGAWNHAVSDFVTEEAAHWGISPNANVWGHSKDTASASVYWEGDKLSMRLMYKYRSAYFQPTQLPEEKTNRFVDDSEFLDASMKYKFTKNFSVSVKALNLLEEPQVQYRGTGTVSEVSQSGRKLFISAKAKF